MQLPIIARFVDRLDGRIVHARIERVTNEAIVAWMRWHYRLEDGDRTWDWSSIYAESRESAGSVECYAAWTDGELQGLMALNLQDLGVPKREVITVDYLATNPANRLAGGGLKHVGTALMAVAILRSIELGFGGRIRLEALSGAETFYLGLGMAVHSERSFEGNAVYVLGAESAKELLEQIREKQILKL